VPIKYLTDAYIDEFQESITKTGRSSNTARVYASDLRLFKSHLEEISGLPGHRLNAADMEAAAMAWLEYHYTNELWAAKTVCRRVTSLRSFARWAGWDPTFLASYKATIPAKARPHPLPGGMDDVDAMMGRAIESHAESALIALCGYMGLRVGEAINVRVKHIDVANKWLVVKWGKGKRERGLPIPDKALGVLDRACMNRQKDSYVVGTSDRTARRWISRMGREAGVSRHVSSHDLRATAGTHWYNKTKDLRVTQELLGHADSRTTELYTGIDDDAMRKAINE